MMISKIFFDITKLCNANCKYCFTNSSSTKDKAELSNDEILKTFIEIRKNKINKVSIGGGEPFLKDIVKIINDNRDMQISITTNGTILNDDIIKCLQENQNVKVTISLDSLSNINSNNVREGINVEYVINNLKTLSGHREIIDRISVRTTISKYNKEDIFDIINFCDEYGIKNLKVNSTNLFGRAKENNNILIPFDEFMKLLDDILVYCKEKEVKCKVELPVEKYLTQKQNCLCGTTSLYIDYKGDVFPCAFTEGALLLGNIKSGGLDKILKKEFDHKNEFCMKCAINRYKAYDKKTIN